MTPSEITAEHLQHGINLGQRDLDWFRGQGVPGLALVRPTIVLKHKVAFDGARFEFARYRHSDDAVTAFVLPAPDADGELADLVGWRPPDRLASWLGRVGLLGEDQVLGPRFEPLVVQPGIADWLRADRNGVVVVDPARAAGLLREAGALQVSTHAQRRHLEQLLTVRPPRIEMRKNDQPDLVQSEVAA